MTEHITVAYPAHDHEYRYCDCRITDPTIERDCCCVGGTACQPANVCWCGKRKPLRRKMWK